MHTTNVAKVIKKQLRKIQCRKYIQGILKGLENQHIYSTVPPYPVKIRVRRLLNLYTINSLNES
jgi:hypothetical protein